MPNPESFLAQWTEVQDNQVFGNAFRAEWELFLPAAYEGTPFPYDFFDGARGVQLAHVALEVSPSAWWDSFAATFGQSKA